MNADEVVAAAIGVPAAALTRPELLSRTVTKTVLL